MPLVIFQNCLKFFTYNNFEISPVVFMPNITTNHAITYTNNREVKISRNTPRGLYFSKALFEGLIFGGAYIRRGLSTEGNLCFKIDWASLIVESELIYRFCIVWLCIWGQFSKYKPPGGLSLEGRFNGRFFALPVWGAYIWRGLYMEGLIFGILR